METSELRISDAVMQYKVYKYQMQYKVYKYQMQFKVYKFKHICTQYSDTPSTEYIS